MFTTPVVIPVPKLSVPVVIPFPISIVVGTLVAPPLPILIAVICGPFPMLINDDCAPILMVPLISVFKFRVPPVLSIPFKNFTGPMNAISSDFIFIMAPVLPYVFVP